MVISCKVLSITLQSCWSCGFSPFTRLLRDIFVQSFVCYAAKSKNFVVQGWGTLELRRSGQLGREDTTIQGYPA